MGGSEEVVASKALLKHLRTITHSNSELSLCLQDHMTTHARSGTSGISR